MWRTGRGGRGDKRRGMEDRMKEEKKTKGNRRGCRKERKDERWMGERGVKRENKE